MKLPLLLLLATPLFAEPNYRAELIKWEGSSSVSYVDNGCVTVGVGHNLTAGRNKGAAKYKAGRIFTDEQITAYFRDDLANSLRSAHRGVKDFDNLPDEAKLIIIDLIWTTGRTGFMKFKNFRLAMSNHLYGLAAMELGDSKWAGQLPIRAGDHMERLNKIP